jgi:hypothetical protein
MVDDDSESSERDIEYGEMGSEAGDWLVGGFTEMMANLPKDLYETCENE